jgi:hypothetical protein
MISKKQNWKLEAFRHTAKTPFWARDVVARLAGESFDLKEIASSCLSWAERVRRNKQGRTI